MDESDATILLDFHGGGGGGGGAQKKCLRELGVRQRRVSRKGGSTTGSVRIARAGPLSEAWLLFLGRHGHMSNLKPPPLT